MAAAVSGRAERASRAGSASGVDRAPRAGGALAGAALVALAGCGPGVVWYGKSPDRARALAVLQDGGGQRVRVDGRDGPSFLGIGVEAIAWSPDGRRLAYPARTADGWVVVTASAAGAGAGAEGARVGPAHDGIGEIAWSADGKHIAYAAERKGRWLVVVDGREGATFEALRARSLTLSPGGKHFAYAADEGGKVVVVSDGGKSAPYEAVGHLALGPSGEAAFVARKEAGAVVVVGGKESEVYEDVADLAFSPSGRRLAWTARRRGRWHVLDGGAESEPYDRVSALVWGAATDALAYAAGRGDEEWVVAAGAPGAPCEGVLPGSLSFDAGGTIIAYAARRKGTWRVVTGGAESPPYEEVEAPLFVGRSAAVAYVARRGEASFLVLDGHQGEVLDGATGLTLSPDGRRFLLAARAGAKVEVLEGAVRGGPCGGGRCTPEVTRRARHDLVVGGTLAWSASGAHSGYLAGAAAGRSLFVVIDGARAGALDMAELMAGLAVDPDAGGALTGDSRLLARWVRAEVELAERRAGVAGAGAGAGAGAVSGDAVRGGQGASVGAAGPGAGGPEER